MNYKKSNLIRFDYSLFQYQTFLMLVLFTSKYVMFCQVMQFYEMENH